MSKDVLYEDNTYEQNHVNGFDLTPNSANSNKYLFNKQESNDPKKLSDLRHNDDDKSLVWYAPNSSVEPNIDLNIVRNYVLELSNKIDIKNELKADIAKVDSKLGSTRLELKGDINAGNKELKEGIAKVDSKVDSTRRELNADIDAGNKELKEGIAKVDSKLGSTRDELKGDIADVKKELKDDIDKVDSKVDSTRNELKADIADVKKELKDDIASLSRQMNERFDKMDKRFEKMDERFEKMDQRFANFEQMFLELRSDHNSLRDDHLRLFTYGKLTLIGILFLFLCIFSVLFTYHDSFFVDLFNKIFSLF